MKRTPMRRNRSGRVIAFNDELNEMRPLVVARAHGLCEVCGEKDGKVIHHKLRRSQGGTNDLRNLALLDDECHRLIHDHPEWAYSEGWLLRRNR